MRRILIPILCTLCAAALHRPAAGAQPDSRPNILLILADDLGYGDINCYND